LPRQNAQHQFIDKTSITALCVHFFDLRLPATHFTAHLLHILPRQNMQLNYSFLTHTTGYPVKNKHFGGNKSKTDCLHAAFCYALAVYFAAAKYAAFMVSIPRTLPYM